MTSTDKVRWTDQIDLWITKVIQRHRRTKSAAVVLGLRHNKIRTDRGRASTYDTVLSEVIGRMMRSFHLHRLIISQRLVIEKIESVAVPNGHAGQIMLNRLRSVFGVNIDGLYRYEIEYIPKHHCVKGVFGESESKEVIVWEKREIRFYVVESKSKKLPLDLRLAIALTIGNKPTIKYVNPTKELKSGKGE